MSLRTEKLNLSTRGLRTLWMDGEDHVLYDQQPLSTFTVLIGFPDVELHEAIPQHTSC